jgi:hypothetical protein
MAESAITEIERLITEKDAERQRIEDDLAALRRILAILRGTSITMQDVHVEGPAALDAAGGQQGSADVAPSPGVEVPRRGPKQESLPNIVVQVLEKTERDMAPIDIDQAIRATGRTMHPNAVTSALSKLWKQGRIRKTGASRYAAIRSGNRHEEIEGNGQLDWDRQVRPHEEEMISSGPTDITHEKRNTEAQDTSLGHPNEVS